MVTAVRDVPNSLTQSMSRSLIFSPGLGGVSGGGSFGGRLWHSSLESGYL